MAVDGAQTAGMFPFNLREMGCDFYAASSHKWLFSHKGVGIFYAREDAQRHLRPLIVANGYQDESVRRFENYNTRNLPELLGLGVVRHLGQGEQVVQARDAEAAGPLQEQVEQVPQ